MKWKFTKKHRLPLEKYHLAPFCTILHGRHGRCTNLITIYRFVVFLSNRCIAKIDASFLRYIWKPMYRFFLCIGKPMYRFVRYIGGNRPIAYFRSLCWIQFEESEMPQIHTFLLILGELNTFLPQYYHHLLINLISF